MTKYRNPANPDLKEIKKASPESPAFPIIGIGASAGGLEALEQFFSSMPVNTGMAFVIIQHLDPNHSGIMPELLQRVTSMKVIQVTDKLSVMPNQVFVIPPNKSMSILNRTLHLFEPTETHGLRLPIDTFLRSLADDQQEKSIGIILSGMGSDGSLGLKAIKERNGIVLVQDPQTAKFDGMPLSAIKSVSIDIIAPAMDLPGKLVDYLKYSPKINEKLTNNDNNKNNLEKIVILLRSHTGHDFSQYKKNTLYRRIERRMNIHQLEKITSYVRYLQENPQEIEILFRELLIGVTNFFRDQKVWDKLKDQILPEVLNDLPDGYILRVWIPGCSTGEEAYSFAMVFKEVSDNLKLHKNISLQIFATDIDNDAINIARKGIFNPNIAAEVTPERLSKFFISSDGTFSVKSFIREMIVFAPHNVISDPPFGRLNFIICRNLLIYFEPVLQKKLMNLFYFSLSPDGLMVLGNAENASTEDNLFTAIDNKLKIYKRNLSPIEIERMVFPGSSPHSIKRTIENRTTEKIANIQAFADRLLLQRFTPPSVIITPDGDIIYISGKTGKYLELPAGKVNMNIYAMAREGLRNELHSGIRKAKQSYDPVLLQNIKIKTENGFENVDVTIQCTENPPEYKGSIIIVFNEMTHAEPKKMVKPGKNESNPTIEKLRAELQQALEDLQSTREEMQTSQEELKSTNEELQSTNEELQSTNEELTTSKEEMQSLNEELQTVNIELQNKVAEFMESNNDMKNLLNSTNIATLFLDKDLNIRRFTDQMLNLIRLRHSDIGRPFTEMTSDLQYPEISEHAREVLLTLKYKENDIPARNEKWYRIRIMPYRTFDDRIDGLVITFVDISESKKLEAKLKETIGILEKHNLYKT
jgi:two-component system, chemotaxis family, CheB/CheR fusion protein